MMNANNKYKTVICKHFEQSGHCYLGDKCHFAHGQAELRKISDPLPPQKDLTNTDNKSPQNFSGYSVPPTVSNYKTIQCKFFEKGHCKYGGNCSFAHGDHEMRSPDTPIPPHILSNMQMNNGMMTSMYDQNTQNQIAQQQITFLTKQMEQYHNNHPEFSATLQKATEMNNTGNVQTAASLVYGIINRPNKSQEDEANYNSFMQQIQSYGNYLYQNLQFAYAQAGTASMFGYTPQVMMPNLAMSMPPSFVTNSDMNQPKQFGAPNYKQYSQPRFPNQNNQDQSADSTKGGRQGDNGQVNSKNMDGLSNMMGNMQVSGQYNPNMQQNGRKPNNVGNKYNQ